MRKKDMKKNLLLLFSITSLLLLGACGGNTTPEATPILSVDAVYTAAAATVETSLTSAALSQPTSAPTTAPSVTPLPSATLGALPTQAQPLLLPTNTSLAGSCNNSMFIKDVTIPDGTLINAGQVFVKTWRIQNTGTCAWTTDYKLTFVGGEKMGAETVKLTAAVQPNQEFDISISFTAPTGKTGDLRSTWQIASSDGKLFGTSFYVLIRVNSATGTSTTGPTATPSSTNTPGPTAIPSSTNTPGPTAIPSSTNTPGPTATPSVTNTTAPTNTPEPTNTPIPPTNTPEPTVTPG